MSAIIELKDVNLAYTSQTMALEDVNLVIPRGVVRLLLDQMVLGSPVYSRSFWVGKPDTGQVRLLGQEAGLERLIAQK